MTPQEADRLARLEQKVSDMKRDLSQNTRDTKTILATLNNLTGGKQALMWITGFITSILVVLAAWLGVKHK